MKFIQHNYFFIGFFCILLAFTCPLYAQEEGEAVEGEPVEEGGGEPAEGGGDVGGGGGGGATGFKIGIGALYTLSISETERTDAGEKNQFFPQLSLLYDTGNFAIGGEILLDATFTVHASGGLSHSKIADSDIIFTGRTYTETLKFGEEFRLYVGYGINQFVASQSLSKKTAKKAEGNFLFSQNIIASKGEQYLLGVEWEMFEGFRFVADYRLEKIPVEVKTSITPLNTGVKVSKNKRYDLDFTFISLGASAYF